MQNIPTIGEITAAAKASAQTTPRPTRAFWIEAILSVTGPDLRDVTEKHTASMNEANLRAFFVQMMIANTPDEDAARARWGAVFGLCEAP